jgi:hypothetical protein
MGWDLKSCAICDWPPDLVKVQSSDLSYGFEIGCPRCGRYDLVGPEAVIECSLWTPDFKNALACAARQASESGQPLRITSANAAELAQRHMNTRVSDNLERLLLEVARRAGRPQRSSRFYPGSDYTLIDCFSGPEFRWYTECLENQQLASREEGGLFVELTLSVEGWKRVQPFPRPGGLPGRCFVAMWISDETRVAYEGGIVPAVLESGFKPTRIDQKEHNNEIPDEIIAEIRNSEFMVADFTGQRPGVYFEAGFAMGLGRKVIWCCRKDEIDKLHFDTNHRNHIDWQTPEELRKRLYDRIRATILDQG